jgi:hypothetical protein
MGMFGPSTRILPLTIIQAASGKTGISTITRFTQMNQDPKNAGGSWNHNTGRAFP